MTMAVAPTAVHQIESASEMLEGLRAVKDALAADLTDGELRLFAMVAQRSGLDPFAKQIYAVKRKGKVTFQTGIDGLRSVAERTREFVNSDEPEYGPPCTCNLPPLGHPEWARVLVYRRRDGFIVEQSATAYWHEYIPDAGQDFQWKKMPRLMLGKCAEALALRKAFPYVLTDIYTPEEMDQAEATIAPPVKRLSARERVAEKAAAVTEAPVGDVVDGVATEVDPESDGHAGTTVGASDSVEEGAGHGAPVAEATPEPTPEPDPSVCGDVAGDGVAEGEICGLAPGHAGKVHKSLTASWPR